MIFMCAHWKSLHKCHKCKNWKRKFIQLKKIIKIKQKNNMQIDFGQCQAFQICIRRKKKIKLNRHGQMCGWSSNDQSGKIWNIL